MQAVHDQTMRKNASCVETDIPCSAAKGMDCACLRNLISEPKPVLKR